MSVIKDPAAVLSYGLNWANFGANDGAASDTGWLQGDTITASTWAVTGSDNTLEVDSDDNSTTETSCVLSGGTVNRRYTVTNQITTAGGFVDERSIIVDVRQR